MISEVYDAFLAAGARDSRVLILTPSPPCPSPPAVNSSSIPGPTVIPDAVLAAMQQPAVDIYSGPLVALTDCAARRHRARSSAPPGAPTSTPRTATAPGRPRSPTCSRAATRCWCWKAAASRSAGARPRAMLGAQVEVLPGDFRRAVQPEAVEARLKADRSGSIKAILVAQIDTASGVVNDIEAIGEARARGRPRRAADGRCGRLARLHAVRDGRLGRGRRDGRLAEGPDDAARPRLRRRRAARARGAQERANMRTPYWDWTFRDGEVHYQKYCGTPPEHLLFALRAALDMIFAEGLENVFRRHRLLAEATRRAVGTWAEGQAIALQRLRAGGALRHGDHRGHAQRRRARSRSPTTAATNAAWCSAAASARSRARRSASRTWATSMRR